MEKHEEFMEAMSRCGRVVCADGFEMSVQAHEGAYCTPRTNNADTYALVEVGFPSIEEPMLMKWAEDKKSPTDTVYGWVPSETVFLVCTKHGGIVAGELPPGIPYLPA